MAIVFAAIFAAIVRVFFRARADIPSLELRHVDLVPRAWIWRPGWFASGRYLPVIYYFTLGGVYMTLGAIVIVILIAIEKIIGAFLPIGPNTLGLFGASLVKPLMYSGSQAARLRRCYSSPEARAVLKRDARPPVLMLRSFADDELRFSDQTTFDNLYSSDRTFEEMVTDQLWEVGPVVAIGRPGEKIPLSGAVREYVGNDSWQERVRTLADQAALIVMVLGPTEGFGWELKNIADKGFLRKVILIMPPLAQKKIERRGARLVSELGLAGEAARFSQVAAVPGALCATLAKNDIAILRSNKHSTHDYAVAIQIGMRLVRESSAAGLQGNPGTDAAPSSQSATAPAPGDAA